MFLAEHVSDPNSNKVLIVFTSPRRAARCNGVFLAEKDERRFELNNL